MKTELLKKTVKVGAQAASMGVEAARLKASMNHLVEDQITTAKRALKRTRYAAEDCLDETEYRIKQHPFRAVGIVFGIGLGVGVIMGRLMTPRGQANSYCKSEEGATET